MAEHETDESGKTNCTVIHQDIVNSVRGNMPADELIMDLGDAFKVFGDSTRLKILCALLRHPMCVCDISCLLGMTKSAVSHQLRILKQSDLVRNKKDGRVVYYYIADDHVQTIIENGMKHITE